MRGKAKEFFCQDFFSKFDFFGLLSPNISRILIAEGMQNILLYIALLTEQKHRKYLRCWLNTVGDIEPAIWHITKKIGKKQTFFYLVYREKSSFSYKLSERKSFRH